MPGLLSRREYFGIAGIGAVATLAGCGSSSMTTATPPVTVPASDSITTETPRPVITDPKVALDKLLAGNRRFVDAQMEHPARSTEHRLRVSAKQRPFAAVLTCSDSRLPPEIVFDQGLGDLFVARVAGNIVDPALMGSVEYAVVHLGVPLVMVIGHERCGAVEATLESIQHDDTPDDDIAVLIEAITPAVPVAEKLPGDLLDNTIRVNADLSRDAIMKSPQLAGPLNSGGLEVMSAYYGLDSGEVTLL